MSPGCSLKPVAIWTPDLNSGLVQIKAIEQIIMAVADQVVYLQVFFDIAHLLYTEHTSTFETKSCHIYSEEQYLSLWHRGIVRMWRRNRVYRLGRRSVASSQQRLLHGQFDLKPPSHQSQFSQLWCFGKGSGRSFNNMSSYSTCSFLKMNICNCFKKRCNDLIKRVACVDCRIISPYGVIKRLRKQSIVTWLGIISD